MKRLCYFMVTNGSYLKETITLVTLEQQSESAGLRQAAHLPTYCDVHLEYSAHAAALIQSHMT